MNDEATDMSENDAIRRALGTEAFLREALRSDVMRWNGDAGPDAGPGLGAYAIVAWVNASSGQARCDHWENATVPARIVITGPDGDRVMAPGDEVVKGERWFNRDSLFTWAGDQGALREFTVRRPSSPCGAP